MDLNTSLAGLPGIGPSIAYRFNKLNLKTVEDLIYHFPFRYEDYSHVTSALDTKIGETVTLIGEIWSIKNVFTRNKKVLTQAIFNDGTSPIDLTWFNQSWLTKQIKVGDKLQISGKVSKYKNKISIVAPVWEKLANQEMKNESLHTGRLVPVYPETLGLTSKYIRARIAQIIAHIPDIPDPIPDNLTHDLIPLENALKKIHFPESWEEAKLARQRLSFDELFYIQLATQKARLDWKNITNVQKFEIQLEKINNFISSLPYKLTDAQNKVIAEIISDLKSGQPMNRLVQGEVGSGKTVVAAVIIYIAYLNGFKSLYMAPTEILAFQHFSTVTKLLEAHGVKIGIYTGSRKFKKEQVSRVKNQASGLLSPDSGNYSPDVIIGTHALLSEKLIPEDVGLIVVDEQQRFGVEQRAILRSKAKIPHFLTMTATPIPRTVALTLYGDLDISVIDELPVGRQPISTHVVPANKRLDAYKFIEKQVKENNDQVYLITPLIEWSETLTSIKAATIEFEKLSKEIFPDLKIGLLHGKLKSKQKDDILNLFKDHKIDILVSTSVVEVGVDVPNATIMVIESADRFGLAQIHQLRGRVGRGLKKSYCLLFSDDKNSISRLKNLEIISNGLKLAELDLKIRGSGEIFGTAQSGRFELKIASFSDLPMIEKARVAAKEILSESRDLAKYPSLQVKLQSLMANVMPD